MLLGKQRDGSVDELMTARDVASHLRMHVITVYRLAQQGKIPGFKVGRQWRFQRDVIDEWEREGPARGAVSNAS